MPSLSAAAENAYLKLSGRGLADVRPWPSRVIAEGPKRTVRRYDLAGGEAPSQRTPVLLVPPLASPAICFDLRRGNSMVEHLTSLGYATYLVDYGPISFDDRELGLEHWVDEVLPGAAASVLWDAGADYLHLVGWCLGGIMSALSVADSRIPAASLSLIGSPFDFAQIRIMRPIRQIADITSGVVGTALYRMLGGVPAPLVAAGFRLTSIDRWVTRPLVLATRLDDADFLAQDEAVERLMSSMLAYPGRTFGQLYHQFFRVNELSGGRLKLTYREIDLRAITTPVLAVAGVADVLAPRAAVHHVGALVTHASEVRLKTAPGGHLGVLTGRAAPDTTWRYVDEFMLDHD